MANFLKDNQKENVRYKGNGIILYEPNNEQRKILLDLIEKNSKMEDNLDIEVNLNIDHIRYIFRELTDIGEDIDSMTDGEIINCIENGNKEVVFLYREVEKLVGELLENIQYNVEQQIKNVNLMLKALKLSKSQENIKNEINKIMKQKGYNMTYDNIIALSEIKNK